MKRTPFKETNVEQEHPGLWFVYGVAILAIVAAFHLIAELTATRSIP